MCISSNKQSSNVCFSSLETKLRRPLAQKGCENNHVLHDGKCSVPKCLNTPVEVSFSAKKSLPDLSKVDSETVSNIVRAHYTIACSASFLLTSPIIQLVRV